MGKIKIRKDDKNRVLLTEVLPYEVPIIFSNDGFYSIVCNNQQVNIFKRIIEIYIKPKDFYIPFNFEIGKASSDDTRTISVIHPVCQLKFIELYEKYNSMMLHLCSKNDISLRKISKIAKFYYSPNFVFDEDSEKSDEVEIEPDILDEETKYIKSYFTYKPIDLIYKFYDRMEFRRLEQRFNFMMTFDISKCFYNIYTHSITWAIKGKAYSKRNIGEESFENYFDKLMQYSNYNETNGIVVGPEISRIFAEIILQRVDIDVLKILENEYKYGFHYEIRRYIDDYFVFANDEKCLQKIKEIYKEKLSFYKLYINQNKSEIKTSPFITNINVAKREINQLLVSFFEKIIEKYQKDDETEIEIKYSIRRPSSISQYFIKDFQCIAKRNSLTYDIISKDVVQFIKREISKALKNEVIKKDEKGFEDFIVVMLDILLYCYSLNINSYSTTFKVAQVIVLICKCFNNITNNSTKHIIYSKIQQDIDNIFTDSQRKSRNKTNGEILNILIALKKLGDNYLLSEKRIKELFNLNTESNSNIEEKYDNLNYFQIITLLYYIENNSNYTEVKNSIEKTILKRYINDEDMFMKSELFLLFFDVISCPFISRKTKKTLINQTKICLHGDRVDDKINEISEKKTWFVNWDTDIDLERILKKKEWGSSY